MYGAFLARTQLAIEALVKHIQTSDRLRNAVLDNAIKCSASVPCFESDIVAAATAPDGVHWRIIDHCTAVTRIYAIYEQFVHEMIREHISLLQGRLAFSDLPQKIRDSYRRGLAKIIERIDGPRYQDVDLAQIISGYSGALSGGQYTIEPRAILMQEQNLRLAELHRFLGDSGIDGVQDWLSQHPSVRRFFSLGDRIAASVATELSELIKFRNDAAHGSISVSDIMGVGSLVEFCEFISAMCEAISELVQKAGLDELVRHNHARSVGRVESSLKDGLVAITNPSGSFLKGSTIYLCTPTQCVERTIVNIRINDEDFEQIQTDGKKEVGFLLDAPCRKGAVIIMMVQSHD